jgi:hypothetical protein
MAPPTFSVCTPRRNKGFSGASRPRVEATGSARSPLAPRWHTAATPPHHHTHTERKRRVNACVPPQERGRAEGGEDMVRGRGGRRHGRGRLARRRGARRGFRPQLTQAHTREENQPSKTGFWPPVLVYWETGNGQKGKGDRGTGTGPRPAPSGFRPAAPSTPLPLLAAAAHSGLHTQGPALRRKRCGGQAVHACSDVHRRTCMGVNIYVRRQSANSPFWRGWTGGGASRKHGRAPQIKGLTGP